MILAISANSRYALIFRLLAVHYQWTATCPFSIFESGLFLHCTEDRIQSVIIYSYQRTTRLSFWRPSFAHVGSILAFKLNERCIFCSFVCLFVCLFVSLILIWVRNYTCIVSWMIRNQPFTHFHLQFFGSPLQPRVPRDGKRILTLLCAASWVSGFVSLIFIYLLILGAPDRVTTTRSDCTPAQRLTHAHRLLSSCLKTLLTEACLSSDAS